MSEALPPGCYRRNEEYWTVIAVSQVDDDGNEYQTPEDEAKIGQRMHEVEWRFRERAAGRLFGRNLAAHHANEPEVEVAQMALCDPKIPGQAWLVRVRRPVGADA
jgi:hypothetical protein